MRQIANAGLSWDFEIHFGSVYPAKIAWFFYWFQLYEKHEEMQQYQRAVRQYLDQIKLNQRYCKTGTANKSKKLENLGNKCKS